MRYAMDDLIGAANEAGFSPTKRLVLDWVELGLLDQPERRGLGRGKGIQATWSEEQKELFGSLLEQRRSGSNIKALSNLPVSRWLYLGDQYVLLRQVRRAIDAWHARAGSTPAKKVKQTIQQQFGVQASRLERKDKKALLEEVTEILLRYPRAFTEDDKANLCGLLGQILDPNKSGLVQTIGGEAFSPEEYVEYLTAMMRADTALSKNKQEKKKNTKKRTKNNKTKSEIDDSLFHWARYAHLIELSKHQRYLTNMTTAGATRGLTIPTFNKMVPSACFDLVLLLGLGLGQPGGANNLSIDYPAIWKKDNLRSFVHGEIVEGSVRVTVEVRRVEKQEAQ